MGEMEKYINKRVIWQIKDTDSIKDGVVKCFSPNGQLVLIEDGYGLKKWYFNDKVSVVDVLEGPAWESKNK